MAWYFNIDLVGFQHKFLFSLHFFSILWRPFVSFSSSLASSMHSDQDCTVVVTWSPTFSILITLNGKKSISPSLIERVSQISPRQFLLICLTFGLNISLVLGDLLEFWDVIRRYESISLAPLSSVVVPDRFCQPFSFEYPFRVLNIQKSWSASVYPPKSRRKV